MRKEFTLELIGRHSDGVSKYRIMYGEVEINTFDGTEVANAALKLMQTAYDLGYEVGLSEPPVDQYTWPYGKRRD